MSRKDLNSTSGTNWAALESRSEENIDYSDIPPLTDEFFERSTLRIPADQAHNFVQLDPDVKQWFQAQGEQYKTLINNVLRQYRENNKTQHIDRTFEKFDRQFPTQQTAATPNSVIAASGPTKEIYGSMKYFLAASRACEAVTCAISS